MALGLTLCWKNCPWYCQRSCSPFSCMHFTGDSWSSKGCSTYSYVFPSLPLVLIVFCTDSVSLQWRATLAKAPNENTKWSTPSLILEMPSMYAHNSSRLLQAKNASSPWTGTQSTLNSHAKLSLLQVNECFYMTQYEMLSEEHVT